jgi:sugar phosphate isomerase/epimerase
MRYGIMAMQIGELVPPGLTPGDAMAHIAGFNHAGLVRKLAGSGFKTIELGGDLSIFLPHTYSPPAILQLLEVKEELAISYTQHLPLWSVEPSTPLTPVRQGSVQAVVESIRATQPLDPEVYVFHATGALAAEFFRMKLPDMARNLILRQFQSGARQSIQTILRETGIASRRLAIETIEFPLDLTLELAEELDLSICFDTGHVLAGFSGAPDFFEALESCLPRLLEVHLHDSPWFSPEQTPGYGLDHQALGRGDLDLSRFLTRLKESKFQGPLIFELTVEQARESLAYLEDSGLL